MKPLHFSAFAVAILLAFGTRADSQDQDARTSPTRWGALRAGGLEAAAAAAGDGYRGLARFDDLGYPSSLATLAAASERIVVADVGDNVSHLTHDGLSILMTYQMTTIELLKGDRVQASWRLVLPGGRVGFANGTWAQLDVRDFQRPVAGERYLIFLRTGARYARDFVGAAENLWTPSFGPLGLYRLSDGGRVIPSGNWRSPYARAIHRENWRADSFLQHLRSVLKQ